MQYEDLIAVVSKMSLQISPNKVVFQLIPHGLEIKVDFNMLSYGCLMVHLN